MDVEVAALDGDAPVVEASVVSDDETSGHEAGGDASEVAIPNAEERRAPVSAQSTTPPIVLALRSWRFTGDTPLLKSRHPRLCRAVQLGVSGTPTSEKFTPAA
jgi:hypothetical protein